MTNAFFDILTCIDNVVEYINDNGGFTVMGWYKHGVINDRTLVSNTSNGNDNNNNEDVQVDNGEIS